MKKSIRVWVYLLEVILAPVVILCGFQFGKLFNKNDINNYAPIDNIIEYRKNLAYINDNYEDEINNRIIVKTNRAIDDEKALCVANGYAGLNVLQYENQQDATDALNYYSSLSYVSYCERDFVVYCNDIVENSVTIEGIDRENLSWGANLLGVSTYQNYILSKYKSAENLPTVYVAVLDTGIDTDNEFLDGRIALDLGISYYDSTLYTNQKSSYKFEDDNSHGTHVSGTIVDLTQSNVKIIPIKVLNGEGKGSNANIISGMEYILNLKKSGKNICAFNMSLGGYGNSKEEERMIDSCYENNIMPVVAAGNENYFTEKFSPSFCKNALTISALEQNSVYKNALHKADYSDYGPTVDLCLPGTDILSCVPNECTYKTIYTSTTGGKYAVISGTSMATPHAAALVALFATYYGNSYNVETIEQKIKSSSYDFGLEGKDEIYGYGVPNMELAIDKFSLDKTPMLSFGEVNSTNNFDEEFKLKITNKNIDYDGYAYKIAYTLDGTYPTTYALEYTSPIDIAESTRLKFAIYLYDENGNVCADSKCYEVNYFVGKSTCNDNATGFEIDNDGTVTKYTSGLNEIVLPEYINGKKVKKLADNLFYGIGIRSFVCDFDVEIRGYPFNCCDELTYLKLSSTNTETLAKYCSLLKTVVLPNSIKIGSAPASIACLGILYGSSTVYGCFNLQEISIPNVVDIPANAFSNFLKLDKIGLEQATSIGDKAFENCENLKLYFNCPNLVSVGSSAFDGSGINGFFADKLETVGNEAFANCPNLENLILPSAKRIGTELVGQNTKNLVVALSQKNFAMTKNLNIFLGQEDVIFINGAFKNANPKLVKIYCYNPNSMSKQINITCIDARASIYDGKSKEINFNFNGYGCQIATYCSDDDMLDDNDVLVDVKNFDGFEIAKNYTFSKMTNQDKYYISVVTDKFGNQSQNIINATGKKKTYNIKINSNIKSVGAEIETLTYYEGESVSLKLKDVKGYDLVSVYIDEVDVTNKLSNGNYVFKMPCKNVEIQFNYEQKIHSIAVNTKGVGKCVVKDINGKEIATAVYNQPIFVSYFDENNCVSQFYYTTSNGKRVALDINDSSTVFQMPDSDIQIYITFRPVNLKDIIAIYNTNQRIYEVYGYVGSDNVINLPQYVTKNNAVYRLGKIASFAFNDNTNIEKINVVLTDYKNTDIEIESYAFDGCSNLKNVNVGKIVSIGNCAFRDCAMIEKIDLQFCKSIGKYSFEGCKSLRELNLSNCEQLSEYSFAHCSYIENINFSDSLKLVPNKCFLNCSSLIDIDLKNVESIGDDSFENCVSMKNINLKNVKRIGLFAFKDCVALRTIDISNCEELVQDKDEKSNAFYGCSSLVEVKNGSELKTIPQYAFYGCVELEKFDFSYIEEIGDTAFNSKCFNKLYFPKLKKIGNYPFFYLKKAVLSNEEILSANELKLSYDLRMIFVEKQLDGNVSEYIKSEFPNRLEMKDYIVYSYSGSYLISFELNDGTILSQSICDYSDKGIEIPTYCVINGKNVEIDKWQIKGTNDFVNASQIKFNYESITYIAILKSNTETTYKIKFYYNYDFDYSGIVNDDGDIAMERALKQSDIIDLPEFEHQFVRFVPIYFVRIKLIDQFFCKFRLKILIKYTFVGWDKDLNGKKVSDVLDLFDENGELKVYATYQAKIINFLCQDVKIFKFDFFIEKDKWFNLKEIETPIISTTLINKNLCCDNIPAEMEKMYFSSSVEQFYAQLIQQEG